MKSKMINVDDEFQYPFACPGGKRGYWELGIKKGIHQ